MKTVWSLVAAVTLLGASAVEAACGACKSECEKPCGKGHKHSMQQKDGCEGGVCARGGAGKAMKHKAQKAEVATIDTDALSTLLSAKVPVVVLDARSGKWDDGRRIPGAQTLTDQSTKDEVKAIVPDKDALIVTYCTNVKCQASPRLAKHLKALGYQNVIEYPAGIDGWEAAGKNVNQLAKN